MQMLTMMIWPFLAALLLTGIHAYFGIHVLDRGVVFVDLALAQIAAFGAVFAILLGLDLHGTEAYLVSLLSTVVGAAIFAWTRPRDRRVPHEAIIGVIYVVATAATILILDRAPKESEHIKHMLVGNILFVGPTDLLKTTVIYGLVAVFHWIFRKRFFAVTESIENAAKSGLSVPLWDFLFYVSFGVVVTSSVRVAGVLLVFSYLIVTAIIGTLLARSWRGRLFAGLMAGTTASLLGMTASATLDLPTGAAIVVVFGLLLAGASIAARRKEN